MSCITMPYSLDCDSCGFTQTVDAEPETYVIARDHERDHPDHFVMIETTP